MQIFYFCFTCFNASNSIKVDKTDEKQNTPFRISDFYEDIRIINEKVKISSDFIKRCKHNLLAGVTIDIRKNFEDFFKKEVFENLQKFANEKIHSELTNELREKLIEIAKEVESQNKHGENFYDIIKSKYEILEKTKDHNEKIKNHNEKRTNIEQAKIYLKMSKYIQNDTKMALFNFFDDYLNFFENSEITVKYYYIINTLKLTINNVIKIIEILTDDADFINSFVILIKKHILIQFKYIKSKITNSNEEEKEKKNDTLKKYAFELLQKNLFAEFGKFFDEKFENSLPSELKYIKSGYFENGLYHYKSNYRISFLDEKFKKNFAHEFKNLTSNFLKKFWEEIDIKFIKQATVLCDKFQKKIMLISQNILKEIKENIHYYDKKYQALVQELGNAFIENEILTKNTKQTIRHILLAESLFVCGDGIFSYDYIKEISATDETNFMDFKTFTKDNKIVLPLKISRLNIYMDLLNRSKLPESDHYNLEYEENKKNVSINKAIYIFDLIFAEMINMRHEVFFRFFQFSNIAKLPHIYNIYYHKLLLANKFIEPVAKDLKSYYLFSYILKELDSKYRNKYIESLKEINNNYYRFINKIKNLFNELEINDIEKNEFQIILNKLDDRNFDEIYLNEVYDQNLKNNHFNQFKQMFDFQINYFLEKYGIYLNKIQKLIYKEEFSSAFDCDLTPVYYLELLGFEDAIKFIETLETIIDQNLENTSFLVTTKD